MHKIILKKIGILLLGTSTRIFRTFVFLLLCIFSFLLNNIRTAFHISPYVIIFIYIVIIYIIIKKFLNKTLEKQIRDVRNLMQLKKIDKALKKVDDILSFKIKDKECEEYIDCIILKSKCLSVVGRMSGSIEKLSQANELYEELILDAFKSNKYASKFIYSEAFTYYDIGFLKDDKEYIKKSITIALNGLDEEKQKIESEDMYNFLCTAYLELSRYENKLDNINKAFSYIKKSEEILKNSKSSRKDSQKILEFKRACVLIKLNEENQNKEYVDKANEDLSEYINYLNSIYNVYDKRYFKDFYADWNLSMASTLFYMNKLKSSDDIKNKFKKCTDECYEYYNEYKKIYSIKILDRLVKEF